MEDQSGQAFLGRETVRLDEVRWPAAQGQVARPGKAVVVVHFYSSGVQHLADSEVAGGAMLKPASHGSIRLRQPPAKFPSLRTCRLI